MAIGPHIDPMAFPQSPGMEVVQDTSQKGLGLLGYEESRGRRQGDQGGRVVRGGRAKHGQTPIRF